MRRYKKKDDIIHDLKSLLQRYNSISSTGFVSTKYGSYMYIAFLTIIIGASIPVFFYVYGKSDLLGHISIANLLFIIILFIVSWYRENVKRKQDFFYYDNIMSSRYDKPYMSRMMDLWLSISDVMSPSLREEFLYKLYKEFQNAPPDIALRSIREFIFRFGLDEDKSRPILIWIDMFIRLDEYQRRSIIDSISSRKYKS